MFTTATMNYPALKMRGLPYSVVKEDISNFFSKYPHNQKSIKIALTKNNTPNGIAALMFDSSDIAFSAMNERQGGYMGNRYVELIQITEA
jgi:RNA recognition motif-containing protein